MLPGSNEVIRYRRNHFSTRLPIDCRYSLAHFWLRALDEGAATREADGKSADSESSETDEGGTTELIWRVGLTGFATRMLGEIVEFEIELETGAPVRIAETIGWIEGFKAVSDLICVIEGRFLRLNPAALADPELICKRPHAEGWLYEVAGAADARILQEEGIVDVDGYVAHLDRTIDKMQEKPWQNAGDASREASGDA